MFMCIIIASNSTSAEISPSLSNFSSEVYINFASSLDTFTSYIRQKTCPENMKLIILFISTAFTFQTDCKVFAPDKSLHQTEEYRVLSESHCYHFCNYSNKRHCRYDPSRGLCVVPKSAAGFAVGTSNTCDTLCSLAQDCKIWNFTQKLVYSSGGMCKLFSDHGRIKHCPPRYNCDCGSVRPDLARRRRNLIARNRTANRRLRP